jgi:aminomuconate-semialdehyde/2-hydroxymuconate-6-semialdehyde dehydrogenase
VPPSEHRLSNFINGEPAAPRAGRYLDLIEPATGRIHSHAPASDASDIAAAVHAAKSAFPAWSNTPAQDRSRLLLRLADLIDANLDRLARAESIDSGKPISLARSIDIPRSAANLRYFATAILHTQSETHDFDGAGVPGGIPALNYTLRKPRGVAGLISPWNLPLYLLTWKIAPALATGNTAVCKPSELTPTTASILGELSAQAGLPRGVLNIVHGTGSEAGAAIIQHPDIPTISFTGSTKVGQWIAQTAGPMLKRISLELGGKNPFIVFDDADFDAAVTTAVRAGFTNQGQVCLCGSRLLIHEKLYDRFLAAYLDRVKALKIGDPLDEATQQGALVSRQHLDKVSSYVDLARQLGGKILCGGTPPPSASVPARCKDGFFFQPTVIANLDPACRVEQEEIFGPVVTIQPFRDDAHALTLANGTPYGLAATLFTTNTSRAQAIAAALEAGIIWINCWLVRDLRTPFGGMKQSGVGREGGLEAIRFFTEPKNVCLPK